MLFAIILAWSSIITVFIPAKYAQSINKKSETPILHEASTLLKVNQLQKAKRTDGIG